MHKKYFTISEVAKLFAVSTSLIRFWEKKFEGILQPNKNNKGARRYTQHDITQLEFIYTLVKEKKYSLEGAKKVIQKRSSTSSNIAPAEIISHLYSLRTFLTRLMESH